MPKVGWIGEQTLRGDAHNCYTRRLDDLDPFCGSARRADEYSPIHVRTDGPSRHHNILYIGTTFGHPSGRANTDIPDRGVYNYQIDGISGLITQWCTLIPVDRVAALATFLRGYGLPVYHQ